MSRTNSVILPLKGLTLALVIIAAEGHSAAQAPSVSYTTYSGPAGPRSINWVTAGPDGALWFTGSGPSKTEIGRITTAGAITEYPISNTPGLIVTGPDGALWFTESNVHQIGRITTGGSITEYPVPAEAEWIAPGPDGALWGTERQAVNIERITTTGVVSEYPVPSPNPSGAIVITAGPDGALWFTNSNPDRIVRITTTGVATQYDFPHPEDFLLSLIAGPDGAFWYSTLSGVIGRMTTDGAITAEYQFGPLGSGLFPYDLTVGPDGALWFIWASVDGGDIALGRISTAGVITQYDLPASLPAGGSSIAKGPDNALWIGGGGTATPFGTTPAIFVRVAIGSGVAITTTSLPPGIVGTPYSAILTAQGGTPPYTWSIIAGSLPPGLSLNPATGAITGTPTGGPPPCDKGVCGGPFNVRVADSSVPPQLAAQYFSIDLSTQTSTFSVASSPSGLSVSIDGSVYTTPHTFTCNVASQHVITATSPQPSGIPGGRYAFTTWSDGVTAHARQVSCTSNPITYQANFTPQYLLATVVSPAGAGSITSNPASSDRFYNSGTAVQLTASVNFLNWSGDLPGSTNPQSVIMNAPKSITANFLTAVTGMASFVKTDASTSGSWKGVYGTDGYSVINDLASYPTYISVTPGGNLSYVWAPSTSDPRAPQKASSPTDRVAACWYAWSSFNIDLAFNDTNVHQVALYLLDWDIYGGGRTQRVDILDANGRLLDTRSISSFVNGLYVVWNLSGHVVVQITNTNPVGNAVMSGLFFGGNATTGSGTAAFLKTDTTTSGSWKGVYGADGYNVINDLASYPAYVSVTPGGNFSYVWASSTSDPRALQKASSPTDRVAACWYAGTSFNIDLAFNDTNVHQVALYLLDWDIYGGGRTQRVDILDGSGNVLDTRSASGFISGEYLVWNLSGHVTVRITNTNPFGNAVVSGLFFH